MTKKHIIILALVGVVSFAATFGVTWMLKRRGVDIPPAPQAAGAAQPAGRTASAPSTPRVPTLTGGAGARAPSMGETELAGLIDDVRATIRDYESRQDELTEQNQRLALARKTLQEDIERLTSLNAQLAATLNDLRRQEQQLRNTRLEVSQEEKANLERLAAAYDKMDAAQASKIMVNMMTSNQMADAVKIIYYMSERTAAKLLGEIAGTQPNLAGALSLELKKVKENE